MPAAYQERPRISKKRSGTAVGSDGTTAGPKRLRAGAFGPAWLRRPEPRPGRCERGRGAKRSQTPVPVRTGTATADTGPVYCNTASPHPLRSPFHGIRASWSLGNRTESSED